MGLCSLTTRRLDVPGEPDQWIEVRPMSAKRINTLALESKRLAREAKAANEDDTDAEQNLYAALILRQAIVAWSYPVEVNDENVDDLELRTMIWLSGEIGKAAEVPLPITPDSNESSAETVEIA